MSMDIGSDTNANVQEDDEKKALNEDTKLNVPIPEHKRESLEVGDISHKNENAMMDVAIGFQFHDLCNLDPTEGTVRCVFELVLLWAEEDFDKYFQWDDRANDLHGGGKKLVATMSTAMEYEINHYDQWHKYGANIQEVGIFDSQPALEEILKQNPDWKKFYIDNYNMTATIKCAHFPHNDPFHTMFVVIRLGTNGRPGWERVNFVTKGDGIDLSGVRPQVGDYVLGWTGTHCAGTRRFGENVGFPRFYVMFEYKKQWKEDVFQFYVLPFSMPMISLYFSDTVDSLYDSAGSYFIAIVALLFIIPNNGAFTRSEKAIVFNALFIMITLVILDGFGDSVTIGELEIFVKYPLMAACFVLNVVNLGHDFWAATRENNRVRDAIISGKFMEDKELMQQLI